MRKTLSLLISISLFTSCNTNSTTEPERVNGIPDDAFWVGGADGGQWYVIKGIEKESLTADISIYNDNTGDLEVDRRFTLSCNSAYAFNIENLKNEINAFDGETIILSHVDKEGRNCILK